MMVNYTWNFGDGNVGYGMKSTYVYALAGHHRMQMMTTVVYQMM
ncbi:MAG TPA: PKD domain-containing protein [Thermoplasmata archaeon]|nr:PKD domain-containing protein [Thermoplasmata archaeon]